MKWIQTYRENFKLKKVVKLVIFFLVFISYQVMFCQEKRFIVQDSDIDFSPPITENEQNQLSEEASQRRMAQTLGHFIPDTEIFTIQGDALNLKSLLTQYTLISYSDYTCGPGSEYIQDVFPELYECNFYNANVNFILLISVDSFDEIKSEKVRRDLAYELRFYRNKEMVYFITYEVAKSLNFFDVPSHIFTNDQEKVLFYTSGVKTVNIWMETINSLMPENN